MAERYDVIVVGGGFAGVTAARECALRGRRVLLLEARDRLGGRTWSTAWNGSQIEYGGAWVHWHQPHTFSELTRAGLAVAVSDDTGRAHWHVGDERRAGTIEARDAIARRGWDRFVEGVREALPQPHAPLAAPAELARFDRLTIAERLDELELDEEERDVLAAEVESVAHGPLGDAGAVSILRWHALSGYSLELAQFTGGRVTIERGTGALLDAIAGGAVFDRRLATPVAAVVRNGAGRGGAHARRRGFHRAQRDRRRRPERARGNRVQPGAPGGQAAGDRARTGQPRRQGDDPCARRGREPELDPLSPPVRLPGHRDAARRRDAADDRLRWRCRALRPGRPRGDAGQPRRDPARLRGARRHVARLVRR